MILKIEGPLLPGSISTAKSRCGKLQCACKAKEPRLHGIYYRWTGVLSGRRTTKTINQEVARECKKRIRLYKQFKKQIDLLLKQALRDAPWVTNQKKIQP